MQMRMICRGHFPPPSGHPQPIKTRYKSMGEAFFLLDQSQTGIPSVFRAWQKSARRAPSKSTSVIRPQEGAS
jgi:hypothetical protein